ncbi:MAG TPA: hypothetical protein DDX84_12805, partial [Nitrospiraceae bacterium]|nr:hypothetical protein [Nitrospiraceae bacterium]
MDSQSEISPKPTSLEEPRKFTRRNLLSRVASVIAATVGVKYGEKLLPTEKSSSEKIAYAAIAKSEQDNLIQDQFKQHRESIPDGIPSEELESHNIFIFPNEKVDLVIRRGALEQEPLFQKVYSAAETSEEGKPILNIVLVDNTWLDTSRKTVSTVPSQFQEHFRNALLNVQKTTPIMFMEGYYERDPSTNIYTIYLATGGYRMPTPEKSNPQLSD